MVTYSFDYADRPSSAAAGSTPLVTSAAYLPFGPETQVVYGNGTTKTMLYDTRYRVQQNKLTGPAGVIAQYDYQEDAAGNITQIHDATDPGFNRDFAYDDLQRLVTANSGVSLWGAGTYSYDAMGNMLSTSVTPAKSFSYDGTTPKLLAVATAGVSHSLSYDAVGNETSYIANRTYSARNQLLSVSDSSPAGHTIAYGYDGRGIRVTRSESPVGAGTARSVFSYAPELNLLGVARDDAPNYDIEWFGGKPLAQSGGTALRYTFTDHLGTPILQTDTTGTVIWRAEYDPYGDIRQVRVGTSTDQPLRFPGQEVAMVSEGGEESYNIFRWYRAGWGRYTQADPVVRSFDTPHGMRIAVAEVWTDERGELAPFRYSEDNPLTVADPLGLFPVCGSGWNRFFVPDRIIGMYDFTTPCIHHDDCYGRCGSSKASCDWQLYREAASECNRRGYGRAACMLVANDFLFAVTNYGQSAFNDAQRESCQTCQRQRR